MRKYIIYGNFANECRGKERIEVRLSTEFNNICLGKYVNAAALCVDTCINNQTRMSLMRIN